MITVKVPAFAVILLLSAICALSQSVVITPKTTVYRRPKPRMDFKRTFSIRRPIATAATPALSKSITAAIHPDTILGIDLKEELGEGQWLEEADYKVIFNRDRLLSIQLWMTGTAAYPNSSTRYVVVDTSTGRRLRPADLFTNLRGLAARIKTLQRAEIGRAIVEIKKDPGNAEIQPEQLFEYANFTTKNLDAFFVDSKGVTFVYNYGFPHVLTALQPDGEYRLSWPQLKPFIRRGGLLARFVR